MLLRHGAMPGVWIREHMIPHLARPALAVDLPGRGRRPTDRTRLSLADAVRSVTEDVTAWNRRQIVLVAHSLSGVVALELAARIPDRIVTLDTRHLPMLARPRELARVLDDAATAA